MTWGNIPISSPVCAEALPLPNTINYLFFSRHIVIISPSHHIFVWYAPFIYLGRRLVDWTWWIFLDWRPCRFLVCSLYISYLLLRSYFCEYFFWNLIHICWNGWNVCTGRLKYLKGWNGCSGSVRKKLKWLFKILKMALIEIIFNIAFIGILFCFSWKWTENYNK